MRQRLVHASDEHQRRDQRRGVVRRLMESVSRRTGHRALYRSIVAGMTRLNVALEPSATVAARLAHLAAEVLPAGSVFRIGEDGRHPHLTLYMAEFEPSALDAVLARVAGAARDAAGAACAGQSLACTAGGYVEIGYAKTAVLLGQQFEIADRLRDLALPVPMPLHLTPTEDQRRNLESHRYELMGDSFRPHVTLGRLAPEGRASLFDAGFPGFSFVPAALMVAIADDQGAARHIVLRAALPVR
jgi:2'-5' RNA ligase